MTRIGRFAHFRQSKNEKNLLKDSSLLFQTHTPAQTCQYVSSPNFLEFGQALYFCSNISSAGNTNRPAPVGSQHRLVSSSPFASLDSRSAARLCSASDGTQKYSFTSSGRRTSSVPHRQPAIKAKSLASMAMPLETHWQVKALES